MKDNAIAIRYADSKELEKWFIEKGIKYDKDFNGNFSIQGMDITNTLKVTFFGMRKSYQYNLEKLKERILQTL